MPLTNTNYSAINTARTNVRSAMINFVTSTLPPLVQTAHDTVAANAPELTTLDDPDHAFYLHCIAYVRQLKAKGLYTGADLPIR